ncbi:MAG: hypothetical protein ABI602_03015 [Candidatus Saccharibacteria bacterium]
MNEKFLLNLESQVALPNRHIETTFALESTQTTLTPSADKRLQRITHLAAMKYEGSPVSQPMEEITVTNARAKLVVAHRLASYVEQCLGLKPVK